MKEQHLQRTAKLLLLVYSISSFFGVAGLASQLGNAADMAPFRSLVPLALTVIAYVASLAVFFIKKDDKIAYIRIVGIVYSVVYFFMLILGQSGAAFPYMLPILLVIMFSLDGKGILIPSIAFVITNIIRIIETVSGSELISDVLESIMIEAIITVLTAVVITQGRKLLEKFFDDSISEISEAADKNEVTAKKIIEVAANVSENTDMMADALQNVINQTNVVYESMNSIAAGTSDTVDSIVNQTEQTAEIQKVIDSTKESTERMVAYTDDASVSLKEGSKAINDLFEQVELSIKQNQQMEIAAVALKDNTEAVRGITNIILGISSQTNLLALNASIEAARAGDAGRGFAVVAEEIRKLAEQTKVETEHITELIEKLASNAQEVMDKVSGNVVASKHENECAKLASSKFDEITDKMSSLAEEVVDIKDKVDTLHDSNNLIVDNVNSLSASSEEISACTSEALEFSKRNLDMIHEFGDRMDNLVSEIEQLK